jgi:hypothetical protein
MAYQYILGADWEYDDAATAADTYSDTHGTIANGIRSYTTEDGTTRETYIKCRKQVTGDTSTFYMTGELDKTYWDAKIPFKVYNELVDPISTDGVEGAVPSGNGGSPTHDGVSFGLQWLQLDFSGYSAYMESNYLLTARYQDYNTQPSFISIGRGNGSVFTDDDVDNFTGTVTVEDLSGNVVWKFTYLQTAGINKTLTDRASGDAMVLGVYSSSGYEVLEGDITNMVDGQYYNVFLRK